MENKADMLMNTMDTAILSQYKKAKNISDKMVQRWLIQNKKAVFSYSIGSKQTIESN